MCKSERDMYSILSAEDWRAEVAGRFIVPAFPYCDRTWADGAAAFYEELIQTSRRWNELGLEGSCPFPSPRPGEIAVHTKNYRLFEAAQLKDVLTKMFSTASDG
jgi:hypothetical protein